MMSSARDYLFAEGLLPEFLERKKSRLKAEIWELDSGYLLHPDDSALLTYLIDKHRLDAPVLKRDDIYALEPAEAEVDVTHDMRYAVFRDSTTVKGAEVEVIVPFDGEGDLLRLAPHQFVTVFPRGRVDGQEIHLIYLTADRDPAVIKQLYQRDLGLIEQLLAVNRAHVDAYNGALPGLISTEIGVRRSQLSGNAQLAAGLGIPIRRRADVVETFSLPTVRRRVRVQRPEAPTGRFPPEPFLQDEEYEHILRVIGDMAVLMERSPRTFARLEEEEIRDLILMQLNGHYEGSATGETFNANGKTDILIRHEGKNAFIAECKFWGGPKELIEALDQLLGYTSWRDTKTALVIFNRGRGHTGVLQKIASTVATHPCFKRDLGKKGETHFRYIFHQASDPDRDVIVSVLAFDVPVPTEGDSGTV